MFKKFIHFIEAQIDAFKYGLWRLIGVSDPLQIKCYTGYGNHSTLRVGGRVLQLKNLSKTGASDSAWKNFVNVVKNWFTDEVPAARIEVRFQDFHSRIITDEEGYFEIEIPLETISSDASMWHEVELTLLEPRDQEIVTAQAVAQIPERGSEFGIISDIDDTVIFTGATSILQMVKNTLLGNAHTRVVFNGVSALYAALARGKDGRGRNPFFYVTSSPWNLYDLILQIFELRSIPRGTLFMTDWGIDNQKFFTSGHHRHKKGAIIDILEFYPDLNFILIGDSGQEDPEIYSDILSHYPDRVLAIYIRDVTTGARDEVLSKLVERASKTGTDLVFAEESFQIAEHAVSKGYIRRSEIPAIVGQQQSDRQEAVEEGADPLE